MDTKSGQLPLTGEITLEGDNTLWKLFDDGVLKELEITGIIQKPVTGKVRVRIRILEVVRPESKRIESSFQHEGTFEHNEGLARIHKFTGDLIEKTSWYLFGELIGVNKIPIAIIFYPMLSMSVYSLKPDKEKTSDFFPKKMRIDPSLN